MKKILVAVVVLASMTLLASCNGDICKCTTKTFNKSGEEKTSITTKTKISDRKECSDLEKAGTIDLGDLGSQKVTCHVVSE